MITKMKIVVVLMVVCMLILAVACQKSGGLDGGAGGKTIGANKGDSNKSMPEKLNNPNVKVLTWSQDGIDKQTEVVKFFENKYGGKVTYKLIAKWQEAETTLVTSMASGEFFDVVPWGVERMPRYAIKGLLQPIDDYFDFNDPLWADGLYAMEQMKFKGRYYGVTNGPDPMVLFFNKTLFENSGVKTPKEYYNEGNWNWNTFRELGIQFNRDTDGNGTLDQFGFTTWEPFMIFLISNQADVVKIEADGSIKLTMDDPKVMEAFQFYQDGYIKDKWIIDNKKDFFITGKTAMRMDRILPIWKAHSRK